MQKILLPVNESAQSLFAVRRAAREWLGKPGVEIHLLHVRRPLSRHIARFVRKGNRQSFHREEAEKALRPCRDLLDQHAIPYLQHVEMGDPAERIVSAAARLRCDLILLGAARKKPVMRVLGASTTNRVLERSPVPVQIVPGEAPSPLERYGLPAGIGAAVTAVLLLAAAD